MKKLITLLSGALLSAACWAGHPVNINTASAEEIADGLDGVGLNKAEAIISYRDQHGPFQHPDELVNVKGIGLSTVDKNRDNIMLEAQEKVASRKG